METKIKMKNKVGQYGVINKTGKIGSSAVLYKTTDPEFWKNIEKGIKSSVKSVINIGYETYSSCQGHRGTLYNKRTLTVILSNEEIDIWIYFLDTLNIFFLTDHPITYLLIPKSDNKTNIMINFGDIENKKCVKINQKYFNKFVTVINKLKFVCDDIS